VGLNGCQNYVTAADFPTDIGSVRISVTCRRNLKGIDRTSARKLSLHYKPVVRVRFDGAEIMRSLYSREMPAVGAHPHRRLFLYLNFFRIKKGRRGPASPAQKVSNDAAHSITKRARCEAHSPPDERFDLRPYGFTLTFNAGRF
jgi:hypothetical protein